ncbi:hypothetical protein AB9P05_06595 [Roseivirga sp. BDSF3-8]|uniref:hypothetical protein n=1 Tax=Roseivirga sp. BDSF3-8 TaxID=3241598 RepID=UPI0035327880
MIKKTSLYLLICLAGSMLSSCFLFGGNDDDPKPVPIPPIEQLPPLTTEGKGTFGCLVNGEPFVSYYPDALADYTVIDYMILSADSRSPESTIGIPLRDYNREEGYRELPDSSAFYSIWDSNYPDCDYPFYDFIEGWVNISDFNAAGEFVSGTFEFTSVNERCDTLRVTDGRFDLRLVW